MTKKSIEINPFVRHNPIQALNVSKEIIYEEVGSIKLQGDAHKSNRNFLIDRTRKTSLYIDSYKHLDEILFQNLTPTGRDMLLYIMVHVTENQDWINLKLDDVRKATGISKNSIVTALKCLKAAGIIALKSQSVYWVNPFYIFKGNRIKFYQDIDTTLINTFSVKKKPNAN